MYYHLARRHPLTIGLLALALSPLILTAFLLYTLAYGLVSARDLLLGRR